ncbi:unnamed protein product [Pleuronectes platessa]|uniref:Uncharacterized protein n=1 Tax=Pleuronectes platessa TaxID=8262 RepID=A0A9N7UMQ5_PLEPL|nr:unnamed protein product [Pleuronectes platessa]
MQQELLRSDTFTTVQKSPEQLRGGAACRRRELSFSDSHDPSSTPISSSLEKNTHHLFQAPTSTDQKKWLQPFGAQLHEEEEEEEEGGARRGLVSAAEHVGAKFSEELIYMPVIYQNTFGGN